MPARPSRRPPSALLALAAALAIALPGTAAAQSLKEQAARLLADANIQAAIARRVEALGVTGHEVLLRLAQQARADIGRFFVARQRWTRHAPLAGDDILEEREVVDEYFIFALLAAICGYLLYLAAAQTVFLKVP